MSDPQNKDQERQARGPSREQSKALARLSAFMPAYNEAANIEEAVSRLHQALARVARQYEIVVVLYEGCSDGTDRILARLAEEDGRLKVVVQPAQKKGYGVALRMGIEATQYPYIFYTDADNQFDPEEIDKLLQLIVGCDIAVGYRGARQDPPARRITALAYNKLMDLTLGTGVKDVDCAFKLYRRAALEEMALVSNTGLIDAEIICRARSAGRRIKEVEVIHYPRTGGEAHFEAGSWFGLPSTMVVTDILRELRKLRRLLKAEAKIHEDSSHRL